jgi:hypothetical protein
MAQNRARNGVEDRHSVCAVIEYVREEGLKLTIVPVRWSDKPLPSVPHRVRP